MIASDPAVPYRRFYRVLALGCVDAALTVPCSAFLVWANATQVGPVVPWTGWAAVHAGFARIAQVPAAAWRGAPWAAATLRWNAWVSPCCALVFFVFFGLSREARADYARALRLFGLVWGEKGGAVEPQMVMEFKTASAADAAMESAVICRCVHSSRATTYLC